MKKKDIVNIFKSTLDDADLGLPISWPNVIFSGSAPYYEVLPPPASRTGGTLKGNEVVREIGSYVINVVVDVDLDQSTSEFLDLGEDQANDYADNLKDLFPEGKVMQIDGGNVVVTKPPDIRAGFRDGALWKVPVAINYTATST